MLSKSDQQLLANLNKSVNLLTTEIKNLIKQLNK